METKQKKVKFSKGEINPKLLERQDLDILDSSASYIKNLTSTPFGSIRTREGTTKIDKVAVNLAAIGIPAITSYAGEDSAPRFGTGADGDIVVTGVAVNIADIYNNDVCVGVTTHRGAGKGLNYSDGNPTGANAYNPSENQTTNDASNIPNCINFTINAGASLSCAAWDGADSRKGIVWIACTGTFTDNSGGTSGIILTDKGGAGGARAVAGAAAGSGVGSGGGHGATSGTGGAGGSQYGNSDISSYVSTWNDLYGSGGGGGVDSDAGAGRASDGGRGAGALRIYAWKIYFTSGGVLADGTMVDTSLPGGAHGGAGGGGGGTIFGESIAGSFIGTNRLTAAGIAGLAGLAGAGAGGGGGGGAGHSTAGGNGTNGGAGFGGNGGAGRAGWIHFEGGAVTGTTATPALT